MGLILVELSPVELDIEGLYGLQGCQRKHNGSDKVFTGHIHSVCNRCQCYGKDSWQLSQRRRAQNRASQRAFRARKEKRMKETEEKLTDLQGQHNKLMQSYERLLIEYSAMKQELETFRSKYCMRIYSPLRETILETLRSRMRCEQTILTHSCLIFLGFVMS